MCGMVCYKTNTWKQTKHNKNIHPSLLSADAGPIGRSEGVPERDMISLRMMGWGLAAGKKSSAAATAAAAVVVVAVTQGWTSKY